MKYATCSQIFTNAFRTEVRHVSFPQNSVLSLARPNFLTGAIIETQSQALLPAPPGPAFLIRIVVFTDRAE